MSDHDRGVSAALARPSATLKMWQKTQKMPLGDRIFSAAASLKAPYFVTVLPHVREMRPGYAEVRVPKWWLVNNHIKTFHAIAACNAAEMAMGMLAEASVPATHRWLPMAMRTKYVAKSTGGLVATATAELPDFASITPESGGQAITVTITYRDDAGTAPVEAEIDIWVTAKK